MTPRRPSRSGSSPPRATRDIHLPEAFRDLFRPSRYKAFYGGRGSGKSHAMATALVLLAAQRPLRILAARQFQRSIRDSSKRLIDDRIAHLGLRRRFKSTETDIVGTNGSAILFAGLATNPESVKSMEGIDIAWVEEAATISQASLEILIPTIRKEGSELWFAWNPRLATDPVDALFRTGLPPPDSIIRRVTYADNPWFPAVLDAERRWDLARDPAKHAHIWDGEYRRHAEAQIFTGWRIDTLDPPEGARPFFGADWGFAADPTVLVRCWLFDRVLFIDHEAYRIGCPIAETGALFRTVEGTHGPGAWPITGDSARPELIDHLRREGFRIKPARKGKASVEDGIAFLQNRDIVVHPRCRHAIDELTLYSFKTDPLTGDILPIPEDRHNHVIDALRYAVEDARAAGYGLLKVL
ncbi:PBSX family phage terminase large subunit [Lichenifustis flavocetrariae]|nr:PBSX family phage terminase large subunit [Lichenifustis flavocetrariae]